MVSGEVSRLNSSLSSSIDLSVKLFFNILSACVRRHLEYRLPWLTVLVDERRIGAEMSPDDLVDYLLDELAVADG